ncbi:cytochrome o ubiquinol oxidase subunit IV [Lichenicoccus sp.]|uniref:cytochrome o ubiquinol oxidase subunit IV n=1 Tax=Lichenicoccus sp. TaxID=2781899 RepID=UPI003D0D2EE5
MDNDRPADHPEIAYSSGRSYVIGFVITVALLGISLLLVQYHAMSAFNLLASISVLAFLTTVAKLVFLFHLDFSETQRWNTLTLMLNVPLLILSIGLTAWMFRTLYDRVMMH